MPKPETFLKHLQETRIAEHNGNIFLLITLWTMISLPKFLATFFSELQLMDDSYILVHRHDSL